MNKKPDKFVAGHIDVVAIISFMVKNQKRGTRITTSIHRILKFVSHMMTTCVSHGMSYELNDGYQQIQDTRFWQLQKFKM
jgi:hypothetical protein